MRTTALCLLLLLAGLEAVAGELRGRVALAVPGVELADVAPVVVYLEAVAGDGPDRKATGTAEVLQRRARFEPGFLLVTAGTEVAMPNLDDIYHNVFSFSAPNDFDLGLYPAGQSRSVVLRHPGVVRLYCSIHESMNGTIFVAPTPHAVVADADGRFRIPDVPEGPWRLRTWSERLPASGTSVEVGAAPLELEVPIGEAQAP